MFSQDHRAAQLVVQDRVFQPGDIACPALRIARQDQDKAFQLLHRHQPQRLDGHELALPFGEPSRQEQRHARIVGDAPALPDRRNPRRRHRHWIEFGKVHAARDRDDPVLGNPVLGLYMRRDPVRIGDHEVAFRHHGIIGPLQPCLARIGAMIGGHEGHTCRLGGPIGAPGWRAGPGMHKADPLAGDQAFQLALVQLQRDRVLRFGIHPEQLAAQRREFIFQPAAFAGQQGPAAGCNDRFGHFQHGALHAAGRKLWRHLQDGLAGHVREFVQSRSCPSFA